MTHTYPSKLYTFQSDIHLEEPFFKEMSTILGVLVDTQSKQPIKIEMNGGDAYNVTCKSCEKDIAWLCRSKKQDTYMLICPKCHTGIVLHELIKRYGDEDMFNRWREARWQKKSPYKWGGIKNRKTKKSSLP